jgi:arabinofuranosyltransferase
VGSNSPLITRCLVWMRPLLLATLALLTIWAGWTRRWLSDDGFIVLRVASLWAEGHGPVFNIGERVEAVTSPLWLVLNTLGAAVAPSLEWFSVMLGILLATLAVVLPVRAVSATAAPEAPLGILVFLSVPAVWDFMSAGLETPLSWLWLSLLWVAITDERVGRHSDLRLIVVAGLATLVRPDLVLYLVATAPVLMKRIMLDYRGRPDWIRHWSICIIAGGLAPAAWQVFRMVWFGTIVPNTALAKSADAAQWQQGTEYLLDFAQRWSMSVALGVVVLLLASTLVRTSFWRRVASLAFLAAASIHLLYIVRVGGDFMHARLLLVPFFAILLPVAAVPWPSDRFGKVGVLAAGTLLAAWWTLLPAGIGEAKLSGTIVDERAFYVAEVQNTHPVTLADHAGGYWVQLGASWRTIAQERCAADDCSTVLIDGYDRLTSQPRVAGAASPAVPTAPWVSRQVGVVAATHVPGRTAYAAGHQVFVVDFLGLSDAFAARTELLPERRIGHQKLLPFAWVLARFAAPGLLPDSGPIAQAALALRCPALVDLHEAIAGPLTLRRAWNNFAGSLARTRLTFTRDPAVASQQACPYPER